MKQVNNPLARFTAFNIHNYYIGELSDPDKDANGGSGYQSTD